MKRPPRSFLLPAALIATGCLPLTAAETVTSTESTYTSSGDIDGDGDSDAIIVDRVTGLVTIGIQEPNGTLTFRSPALSGLPDATSVAVGEFHAAGRDSIALTSPFANRVQLLDPQNASLQPQTASFPVAGPRLLAPFDVVGIGAAGLEDLALTSSFNGLPPVSAQSLPNQGDGTFGATPEENIVHELLGWQPVSTARTGGSAHIAFIENSQPSPLFRLVTPTSTTLTAGASTPAPFANQEFVFGQFDANESDFIFFTPGSSSVAVRRLDPGGATFSAASNRLIAGGIQQMVRLERPGSDHVLVINNSKQARIYSYDSTTGFSLEQSLNIGLQSATTALPLGDGSVALLTGNGFFAPADSFSLFAEDGMGAYQTFQDTQPLPALDRSPALGGNLFFFGGLPLIDENPPLVGVMSVADWSSGLQLGGPDSAVGETFFGGTVGLGNPTPQVIGTVPQGTIGGLANQHQPDISFSSLRRSATVLGDVSAGIEFIPAGGSYEGAIQIDIEASDPGSTIFYRTDGTSIFTGVSNPFWLFEDATVQAYAKLPNGDRTPVVEAYYTFSLPPEEQDSDSDGVPDFVELEKALDPSFGADTDGDGSSDLAELLAGTDPSDANDFPDTSTQGNSADTLIVNVTPHAWDGASNGPVATATGIPIKVHDVGGALLGAGVTSQPLSMPSARFSCDPFEPDLRYLVVSTPAHYDINSSGPDSRVGREMIGLIPAPDPARLTWSVEVIDDTDDSGQYASLAISPTGRPAISYLRATNPPYNGTLQFAELDAAGWSISQVDGDPTTSGNGYYSSLAFTPAGDPAISYLEGSPNNNLRYAQRQAASWNIETVDGPPSGGVGRWTSLAMLPTGSPAIAYQDFVSRDVKYAYKDGSTWQAWTAASTGRIGSGNSLAIDPTTGEPLIGSFELNFDFNTGDADESLEILEFAGIGSLFNRQTVADNSADPLQTVGRGPSLAFDPATQRPAVSFGGAKLWFAEWDGAAWQTQEVSTDRAIVTSLAYHPLSQRPAIAYYENVNDNLVLASFNGSGWTTEILDSGGDVGDFVSLAFSPDGLPHIAYYDRTNNTLKYATREFVPGAAVPNFSYDALATAQDESARWIGAAVAAAQANGAQTVSFDLKVEDVLAFLLVENRLGELMFLRGVGSSGSAPSFSTFRPSEITNEFFSPVVTPDQLLALESVPPFIPAEFADAIRLREFLATVNAMLGDPISNPELDLLKTLGREVYRISSSEHNDAPSSFRPPFDVLRQFIQFGALDPAYETELVGLDANALATISSYLSNFRSGSEFFRTKLIQDVVHLTGNPADGRTYAEAAGGGTVWELRDANGNPFELPQAFHLSDGTPFRVIAFDDLDPTASPRPIEVIAIQVTGVALPSPTDSNGNLLPDDWEQLFFGHTTSDAFVSADGSGYSSLQQYLEGTDPTDPAHVPSAPIVTFDISTTSAGLPESDRFVIGFTWPTAYAEAFEFVVQTSVTLENFALIPATIQNLGGGNYSAEIILPDGSPTRFFRVAAKLK